MKAKILFTVLAMIPMAANAAIPYRVEQVNMPPRAESDTVSFARQHRFYIGGAYNFSLWSDAGSDTAYFHGKNTSGFDAYVGYRISDIFRIDAGYMYGDVKYDAFSMHTNAAVVNAIFDARIDGMYRLFRTQRLVPYVGIGAGASWNSSDDVVLDSDVAPLVNALAGLSIEMGEHFAVDLGYRYYYMFTPQISGADGLNPSAHQFRAGVRINF